MALIGTIRKNMWFVFVLLGVALVAFMFMDSQGPGGGAGAQATAFSVNGEKITAQQYQALESSESNTSGLTGNALRSKVFDDLVTRTLISKEQEALGLGVGEEEMEDLMFGSKLSPVMQQLFRDRRTGQVDFQQLQLAKDDERYEDLFERKSKEVESVEVQNKLGTLVTKGIYTPSWMADELTKTNSIVADIEYVKVPTIELDDSAISLSDSDYKAYMDNNSAEFNSKEEGRVVEYFNFNIITTAKDSADLRAELSKEIAEFRTTTEDSTFALRNNGNYINVYFKTDDIPDAFQTIVPQMEVGQVTEPTVNERYFTALKLIDKKVVADSVGLSHIYRNVGQDDQTGRAIAIDLLDSIKTEIEAGRVEWDSMALANSQDQTNAANGGDLGKITQGTFFPSINQVAFFSGKVGNIYLVESPNGVHLIRVDERVFDNQDPKYKVAFINELIEPSNATVNTITSRASQFIADNRSLENARNNIANYPEASIATSKVLKKGDYEFEEFGYSDDARNVVSWAFKDETSVGDVSADMFSFRDPQFGYETNLVVPALQAKTKKGMANLADVKSSITPQVMEYAKAMKIAEMMKGKSIDEIQANMAQAAYGQVNDVRTGSGIIQNIGSEPKVVASIISTGEGSVSEPIVGSGGVYMIKVLRKQVNSTGNQIFAKQSENIKARQNVNYQLLNALKEQADIKDKRMEFGM